MIFADVKANKSNKKQKIWWLYLSDFYKKYLPSKFETKCKRGMCFPFDFGWYSIILILFVKKRGGGV